METVKDVEQTDVGSGDVTSDLQNSLELKDNELKIWHDKCNEFEENTLKYKELCEVAEKARQEIEEDNQRLLSILTEKEDTLTNQAIEIDQHNEVLANYTSKINELNTSISGLNTDMNDRDSKYKKELANLQKSLNDSAEELKSLSVSEMKVKDQCSKIIEENDTLVSKLDKRDKMIANFKEQNSTLTESVSDLNRNIEYLSIDLKAAQDDNGNLMHSLKDRASTIESLQSQLHDFEEQITILKCENGEMSADLEKLKEIDCKKSEMNEKLNVEFNNLKKSHEELKEKVQFSEQQLKLQDDQIVKCQSELDTKDQLISNLEQTTHNLQLDVENRTQSIYNLENSTSILNQQLVEANSKLLEIQQLTDEYVANIANRDEQINILQSSLSSSTSEIESLKDAKNTFKPTTSRRRE